VDLGPAHEPVVHHTHEASIGDQRQRPLRWAAAVTTLQEKRVVAPGRRRKVAPADTRRRARARRLPS
jgi:hypothetical protein